MSFADQADMMIRQLDESYEAMVETARSLRLDYMEESRAFMCYRIFSISNERTSMRIHWGRVVYKGNKRMKNLQRIQQGVTYNQSVKFMGDLDLNHQLLFSKYEPQLAVLRELSDKNRTARKTLVNLLTAAKVHKM